MLFRSTSPGFVVGSVTALLSSQRELSPTIWLAKRHSQRVLLISFSHIGAMNYLFCSSKMPCFCLLFYATSPALFLIAFCHFKGWNCEKRLRFFPRIELAFKMCGGKRKWFAKEGRRNIRWKRGGRSGRERRALNGFPPLWRFGESKRKSGEEKHSKSETISKFCPKCSRSAASDSLRLGEHSKTNPFAGERGGRNEIGRVLAVRFRNWQIG